MKISLYVYIYKKKNIYEFVNIGDGIINILGLQNAANGKMVEIFIKKYV
jgi:hypothetical protein